jgi:hypothetical protein
MPYQDEDEEFCSLSLISSRSLHSTNVHSLASAKRKDDGFDNVDFDAGERQSAYDPSQDRIKSQDNPIAQTGFQDSGDLPIGQTGFQPEGRFERPNDIEQTRFQSEGRFERPSNIGQTGFQPQGYQGSQTGFQQGPPIGRQDAGQYGAGNTNIGQYGSGGAMGMHQPSGTSAEHHKPSIADKLKGESRRKLSMIYSLMNIVKETSSNWRESSPTTSNGSNTVTSVR